MVGNAHPTAQPVLLSQIYKSDRPGIVVGSTHHTLAPWGRVYIDCLRGIQFSGLTRPYITRVN